MPQRPAKPERSYDDAERLGGVLPEVAFRPAPRLPAPAEGRRFPMEIALRTNQYRPNHMVTIRNSTDGFARDIYGEYADGTWRFGFPEASYSADFEFKFVLDGEIWSAGPNLRTSQSLQWATVETGGNLEFESQPPHRFLHQYGRLRVDNTRANEQCFRGNRDESKHYRVIVIGGGMMGGIIADDLTDAGIETLVLEVGVAQFTTHADNLFLNSSFSAHQVRDLDPSGSGSFWGGTNMLLGGRSVFWSGVIPRIMDFEYALPYWPAGVAGSLKDTTDGGQGYYSKAEQLLEKMATHGTYAQALVRHFRDGLPNMVVNELPWSFSQPDSQADFLGSHQVFGTGMFSSVNLLNDCSGGDADPGARHLTVNTGHMAVALETNGDQVVAVRCQDLLGNVQRRYTADIFVVALGSVQSPNLALNSGLRDRSGKLGVGLTDHPELGVEQFELPAGNLFHEKLRMAKLHFEPVPARQGPYLQAGKDKFPFYAEVNVSGASKHVDPWGNSSFPSMWRLRFSDQDVWLKMRQSLTTSAVSLKMRSYAPLNDANRIHARGAGERPNVEYHGYLSGFLTQDYLNSLKEHGWLFKNELLGALDSSYDQMRGVTHSDMGTIQHSSGSLRMGDDGTTSVVDSNLRFHEYRNLFASDASVLPYCLTCNPSLTVAALTLRLADHLKALLGP